MKTPEAVVEEIRRRLQRTWTQVLVCEVAAPRASEIESAWPHAFTTGSGASSGDIAADFASTIELVATWRDWADRNGIELRDRERRIGRVGHTIPSHVVIPDADAAAAISGAEWIVRLERGRHRMRELAARFPALVAPERMLAAADRLGDVDFDLLLRAGEWFAAHSTQGLTPRQVPLEGFHAKWLNTSQHLVAALANTDDLGLSRNHPPRIHFTYLDPDHLTAGGRKHDSATVGDAFEPAYDPRVVIISENKDTAINFPEVPGAISVEGVGRGGSTIASFDWITDAPTVVYWGDMDADGLEILDGFRAAGVPARSVLMDRAAYARWERYGTNSDSQGVAIRSRDQRAVPNLTAAELELYRDLTGADWARVRRIEQERVPLPVAAAEIQGVIATG